MPPCLNLYIRSGLFDKMDKKKMSVPLFYWCENDGFFLIIANKGASSFSFDFLIYLVYISYSLAYFGGIILQRFGFTFSCSCMCVFGSRSYVAKY